VHACGSAYVYKCVFVHVPTLRSGSLEVYASEARAWLFLLHASNFGRSVFMCSSCDDDDDSEVNACNFTFCMYLSKDG
jgi:hypothetical protein